jgi:hypothetical protein
LLLSVKPSNRILSSASEELLLCKEEEEEEEEAVSNTSFRKISSNNIIFFWFWDGVQSAKGRACHHHNHVFSNRGSKETESSPTNTRRLQKIIECDFTALKTSKESAFFT